MASMERLGQAKIFLAQDGGGSARSSRDLIVDLEATVSKQSVSKMKPLIVGEDGLVPVEERGLGTSVTCFRLVDGEERIVTIYNQTGQYDIYNPDK